MSSTWADLFDRAAEREASLEEVRDALERVRESAAAGSSAETAGGGAATEDDDG